MFTPQRTVFVTFWVLITALFAGPANGMRSGLQESTIKQDTARILALAEKAYVLYKSNADSSLMLARQARDMSEVGGYTKGLGRSLRVIGIYYWTKSDYEKALAYFKDALQQSEKANDLRNIADCYRNIAVIHRARGQHIKALEYNFHALKLYEKVNDKRGLANLHNNIGLIYKEQTQFDQALEYLRRAGSLMEEIADTAGIARVVGNIGIVYQDQMKFKEALPYQLRALEFSQKGHDLRGIALGCNNLADIYIELHDTKPVLSYLERGMKVAQASGFQDIIGNIESTYAKYFNRLGNYQEAIAHAGEGIKRSVTTGNAKVGVDAWLEKSVAASGLKRHADALEAYLTYITLRDSLRNIQSNQKALISEFAFREEKSKMEKEKLALEYVAKSEKQTRVVNTFGGIIFTLVAISAVIIYHNRRIQSKKRLLMNQQDELARQNHELINSREEIAAQRDILAAQNQELKEARSIIEQQNLEIKLRNERLEDDVNERTRVLSDYNEQLEQFAFISAHNLRAPVARILGLGELLKHNPDGHDQPVIVQKMIATTHELDEVVRHLNMILNIQHDSSISITAIDVAEEAQEIRHKLHEPIKISGATFIENYAQAPVCFTMKPYFENILHTLLENAIRYRNPERSPVIRITTSVHDGHFCLEVEDNGLGIDLAQFRNKLFTLYSRFHFHVEGRGIGLYLLKTQVNALKGRIEVESTVNEGTVFRIYFIHSDPVMRKLLNQVVSETRNS